ncbi:MAG: PadR family transcriptional regulator [Flexilinea sp.]
MSRKQDPLSVEYILLGIIRRSPIHAYDLAKMLGSQEELRIIWRFNQSQLYAVLEKIERNGLIQSEIKTGAAFPFRKVYSLTEKGDELFKKWKMEPVQKPHMIRSDFMAKLYFLKDEPRDQFEAVIHAQIVVCEQWLENFRKRMENLPSEVVYQKMVFDFRMKSLEAMIEWLNSCLEIRQNSNLS